MKFNSIALGKTRGSMGNFTTQNWKGINVARAKPVDVANPNTVPQQTQRHKFALLVALSKALGTVLAIGMAKSAVRKTVFNLFVSLSFKNGTITDEGINSQILYDNVQVSSGSAVNITSVTTSFDGTSATVTIAGLLGAEPPVDSVMYAAVVDRTSPTNPRLIGFASKVGIEGGLTITCSEAVTANNCFIYTFYVNSATNQPCDSIAAML